MPFIAGILKVIKQITCHLKEGCRYKEPGIPVLQNNHTSDQQMAVWDRETLQLVLVLGTEGTGRLRGQVDASLAGPVPPETWSSISDSGSETHFQ